MYNETYSLSCQSRWKLVTKCVMRLISFLVRVDSLEECQLPTTLESTTPLQLVAKKIIGLPVTKPSHPVHTKSEKGLEWKASYKICFVY